jgi:hypothetical protein
LLDIDLSSIDTQRIGRMGELVVELELLSRGWLVGNFNATTVNSAGWDLFATKGGRSVRIRVKAKRPGTSCFVWSKKRDGRVFNLLEGDADDVVAAVSFEIGQPPCVYILPSQQVERDLLDSTAAWLAGERRGGGQRKETSVLRVHIDDRIDVPGHGFGVAWAPFLQAWAGLERPSGIVASPQPPGDAGREQGV